MQMYVAVPRMGWETEWETSIFRVEHLCAPGALEAFHGQLFWSATRQGAVVRSFVPERGWMYKIPGSSREIPCGENTDGARPVWMWWAS